jgi:ABC-type branched-subunit amino acid transport system substrate-binding protein
VGPSEIRVGTIADVGFVGRPGLHREFFDVADAFAAWCNAAGGIDGRRLRVDRLDAKVVE